MSCTIFNRFSRGVLCISRCTRSEKLRPVGKIGAVAVTTLLLHACAAMSVPPLIDEAHAPLPQLFRFSDGGEALYYVLDKDLALVAEPEQQSEHSIRVTPADKRIDTFVFFISGSGCSSLRYFLPRYFDGLEGESGPIRVFMLQKRFIYERSWGRVFGCSRGFTAADHPGRWLADQHDFITAQVNAATTRHRKPVRIVIAGVSEGAEIVPLLARMVTGATHVVLLGNGGMPPMEAYRLQLARHGMRMPAELDALMAPPVTMRAGLADPAPLAMIAGHTWQYWAELARLDPAHDLLALAIPVWVAMGEADEAVPIASALYLEQTFASHQRTNLFLKIYAGADHALSTNSQTNTADFWLSFDRSMSKSQLLPAPTLP